jgi:hypothetical protein
MNGVAIRSILAAGLSLLVLGACGGGGDEAADGGDPAYIQAHTIQQLMAHVVQPTADNYWQSVQYISDEQGYHEIEPKTDEDWQATRTAAATLVEMGNLLMTPLYAEERGEDWMDFARGMVQIGQRAEQAAIDKDVDAVFEVGGTLYNVCSGCHANYPPSEEPGADPMRPAPDMSLDEYTDQTEE